jgi:hypothetical protein
MVWWSVENAASAARILSRTYIQPRRLKVMHDVGDALAIPELAGPLSRVKILDASFPLSSSIATVSGMGSAAGKPWSVAGWHESSLLVRVGM